MSYNFTASIVKEGKWFVARAIEVGVTSQGRTIEEAKKNLQEAVELYLENEPQLKKQISKESPLLTTLQAEV
ncbi:MAG: type II toxin-antitoxin system HicB family antitoxin [Candidatus Wildermuthbacteria bacterium]|nr:type II toxin-antitoxin system HicB family antitoxin [Candidatus Wildermuthbacteria bacterium]